MAVSMAIFVFVYILCLRILNKASTFLTSRISSVVFRKSSKENDIKQQIRSLKAEQMGIKIEDEFAKHAKLQRRINKLSQVSSELAKTRGSNITKMSMVLKIVFTLCMVMCHVCFIAMYRKIPVALFPHGLLSPLQSVFAFPTGIPGAIGLPCWVISCNRVLSSVLI